MKTTFLASIALLGLCAAACKSSSNSSMVVDPKVMEQNMMAYMTTGEAHRVLDAKVGTWKVKVRMFNPDGSVQSESDMTSEGKWIMNDHYVEETVTGSFGGMPFAGRALIGYDNLRKKYVSTWYDNMGTGVMFGEGTYDPKTKTFHSKTHSPNFDMTKIAPSHSTEQNIDKDHWLVTSFSEGPGEKAYKSMTLEYARSSR